MRKFVPVIAIVMLLGLMLSGFTQNQAAAQPNASQPQQSASQAQQNVVQPQQNVKPGHLILDGAGAQPFVPKGPIDYRSQPLPGAPNPPATFTNYRAVTDDNSICNTTHTNCSQHEPYIAINPNNPLNIVAASKDWRPADGNQKHIWIYTTMDGGVTWANQGITYPVGSGVVNSSDVIIQWDASPAFSNTVYVNPLVYNATQLGNYVTKSTDGGLTWGTAVRVDSFSDDKNWMNIDKNPSSPYFDRLYVCWWDTSGNNDYCSYSADHDVTWSAPVLWGTINQGFVYPVIQPNGTLDVFYNNNTLDLVRSTDGGNTFGAPITAANITGVYGNRGSRAWRVNSMQAAAAGPEGNLYLTWLDDRNEATTGWDIYFTRSTNNGTTWSAPQKVNDDTQNRDQFEPAINVAPNGRVDIAWMDMRNDPANTLSDVYYSSSSDGGLTFSANQRVTDVNFNLNDGIPSDSNGCAGDYMGLSSTNNDVWVVWSDTRNSDGHGSHAQDAYTGHMHIDTGTPTPTVTGTPPTNTPTGTATNTPLATNTPSATPTPCGPDAIVNGGFETGTFAPWVISDTNNTPTVVMTQAHSGTHSALLGALAAPEPLGDSTIYQTVAVPAGGTMLSYWYYPTTADTIAFDWQDAYVENSSGTILATIMHIADNTQTWTNQTFDMTPYAGQTVRIVFLVHEDGFGDITSMYVDDVSLRQATSCGTVTGTPATSTPINTATSTPTPSSTPCFSAWYQDSTLPQAVAGEAAVTIGNYIYEAGGYDGSHAITAASRYNGSGNWQPIASLPIATTDAAAVTDGSKFYVIGGLVNGVATNNVQVYNPTTNSWSMGNPSPLAQGNAAATYINNIIYVFGGNVSGVASNTVQIYDTTTGGWTTGAAMPQGKAFESAIFTGDALVPVAGGIDNHGRPTNLVLGYDYSDNRWGRSGNSPDESVGQLPEIWWGAASATINNQLFMFGGVNAGNVVSNKAIYYEPADQTWHYTPGLNVATYKSGGAALNGHLYILGGSTSFGTLTPTNRVERYDAPACTPTPQPSNTATVQTTNTPLATSTPGGPTNTMVPATSTPAPPTVTPGGPTNTPVLPTVTPTDCPNPFTDVTGNLFYTAIHYLNCRGVVNGTDQTHYSPAGTSTRGQFAKVVVLGFGTPLFTPTTQDFVDVPPSYFAYLYIESGFHAGILSGFDPASCAAHGLGTPCYLPNQAITRGQLTKLVVNAGGYTLITPTGGQQDFTDVPTSNVFYVSIETAYHAGIINGYPNHTFLPNANIRRDEMAQIVYEGILHRPSR